MHIEYRSSSGYGRDTTTTGNTCGSQNFPSCSYNHAPWRGLWVSGEGMENAFYLVFSVSPR